MQMCVCSRPLTRYVYPCLAFEAMAEHLVDGTLDISPPAVQEWLIATLLAFLDGSGASRPRRAAVRWRTICDGYGSWWSRRPISWVSARSLICRVISPIRGD